MPFLKHTGPGWHHTFKPLMSRDACNGENGKKSPEGWRFKFYAKIGPLESGDFGENGKIWQKMANLAQMAKNRQRAGISRTWQILKLDAKWPLEIR